MHLCDTLCCTKIKIRDSNFESHIFHLHKIYSASKIEDFNFGISMNEVTVERLILSSYYHLPYISNTTDNFAISKVQIYRLLPISFNEKPSVLVQIILSL